MIEVDQKSDLGKLGLSTLVNQGLCGPNYDVPVCFSEIEEGLINVSFYGMEYYVNEKSKHYQEIKSLLKNYQE